MTKADLDAIQRQVNEFRVELTALEGVRVTPIEKEIPAIQGELARLRDRVTIERKINVNGATPDPIRVHNENPNLGGLEGDGIPRSWGLTSPA